MPDFDPNEYLKKQSQSKGFDPNKYLEENPIEKKNSFQNDLPTGTQTSKRGLEPFLPQVPTKTPSVLLSDEQKQQREKQRIGERFETTLLNVPTEFGKVDQFMRSAKKVKDTLPQIPTIKPSTGGMVVIPQGEKIGDSLRKGDTLQDELTDKLTGKKTALQKQIESAQEAFRTVQGEDVYGEIQDAQQLDNMSPERVEAERERKGNYVKFLYNQFLDGTGSAVSGLVDVALAIDKGMPLASPLSKSGLILDYYRKNNAKGVRNFLRDNIGAEVDKGLEAKYNEGMLTGAIGGLASSAPAMLTGGMTKGLSMVAQMYDGAIQSIESRPDADQWDNDTKTLFAGTLGLIQGQLEKYGLDKVLKGGELTNVIFKKILKSAEGKKITGNILENLIDENVKGVARVFAKGGVRAVDGFASEFYTGAGQEASAIGIESLFDKVTGKPIFDTSNKTNWIGFVDRIAKAGFQEGIGGFALGGGVGMLSGISKKKVKEAQTVINEIDRQLENPDTLPEVAEVLIQRKADTQANIDDIVDEEADNQSKMSSEDFVKSQELSKQIEKIDLALQDPNTGESVKADLESQKKAIESEIDEIIKKKPPIEPPATGGAGVEARIQEIESLLSSDNASMQETGSGNLIKEGREELVLELAELKKKSPVASVVKPQGKQDAKKADYTKRIEKKIANASEEKNPIKKALILYEALDSATRVDTGQKENVQELLNAHLAESGLKIENVEIGTKYNETNTSLDATIAGDGIENLKVIEVLSPIIRDANGVIVKQGKVIVESSDNKKTPQVAKPTIDTEEQIIAEGQQAEADISATDLFKIDGQDKFYHASSKKREGRLREGTAPQFGKGVYFSTNKDLVIDEFGNEVTEVQIKAKKPLFTNSKEEVEVKDLAAKKWNEENLTYDSENEMYVDKDGNEVTLVDAGDLGERLPISYYSSSAKELGYDVIVDKDSSSYDNEIVVIDESIITYPEETQTQPQEDAIQVETAGQVPVLTEAPVGEEVEQGKPQPKAKVVTEEGKEEVGGDVESTAKALEGKYGIILDLAENKNGDLSLGRIIVPKENRSKGVGKKAMQDIVDYADKNGKRILLTPSTDFGATSVARLKEFYKEFGFIENKGKNKDFTTKDSMYRNPQSKQEQTPAQEVEQLRAEEQAELKAAIPNADQYLTNGKVDRDKITDPKDINKYDEIYDKYDKLITPLLPKSETKAGSVGVGGDVEVVPLETVGEDIVYRGIDKRGFGGNGGGVAGLGKGLYTTNSKEEAQKYAWEDGRTKGKPVALKNAKPINSLVLNDGNVQKWIDENLPKSKYKNESDFRDNLSEYVTGLGYDGITIKSSNGVEIYVKYTEQSIKSQQTLTEKQKLDKEKLASLTGKKMTDAEFLDYEKRVADRIKSNQQKQFTYREIEEIAKKVKGGTVAGAKAESGGGYTTIFFHKYTDADAAISKLRKEGYNVSDRQNNPTNVYLKFKITVEKAVEQSLKETPQAEPTLAKPKTEPRLKPRVETRIKFTKAIELFNDISAADGAAKKGTLTRKRQKFLAQNPSIKYIDDNWRKISDQLKAKGLIETKGNCP